VRNRIVANGEGWDGSIHFSLLGLMNFVASMKITHRYCKVSMDNDLVLFFGTMALFILYLVWSAKTEMGTKSPWKK